MLEGRPMQLPDFSRSKVLVVGDVMLDRYWHGPTSRISPEAPVPVVRVARQENRLGGAGNVAANAAALGASTRLLGLIGEDSHGQQIVEQLQTHRVANELIAQKSFSTITKLRVISRQQQLIRLDFEDEPADAPGLDALLNKFSALLGSVSAVVLSDYAKGALQNAPKLIAAARAAKCPVVVDPKGKDFSIYSGASVITPNMHEFEAVVGVCRTEEEIAKNAHALCKALSLDALLVTRSEKGMTLVDQAGSVTQLPTLAQEVFDVTGAGDTVVATIAAALGCGASMVESVRLSNAAAGIVVGKLGTATVSANELQAAIHSGHRHANWGICSQDEIKAVVREAKARNETVVMTNGCFDILHPGHVDYLERARALGDMLVVAVNDDGSVARLKGLGRPLNSLHSRMRMLSALACVDWVIPFSEDTPERIISELLPNVLVKGGDYTPEQIAGAPAVLANGGEVKVLPFLEGHSTTGLIEKIQGQT
jgi:D-beta-D-heptose 7-phosphate kinase/D-beta-D-heptose 1-phosphate adenosyltransferase